MTEQLYEQLGDLFNQIGFGSRSCPELYDLLRYLFTEDEARVTLKISPFAPEAPEQVAARLGDDPERISNLLDKMADKGLIYCSQRGDEKWYKTIQLVPGIFELQFMKGEVTPRAKELAKLFDAYFHSSKGEVPKPDSTKTPMVSFARVIPIEKTVETSMEVFPYEQAKSYIDNAKTITVSVCYCRHEKRLLDQGCDFPDDVCLQFDSFASFVKERGFGREITRDEAHEIMKRSSEAGLVATSSNTRDRIDFICNCCTCCCGVLRSVKESRAPVRAVASNYLAEVKSDECTGCAECVDRCQMDAITMEDDMASVEMEKCIGCGVCVPTCPVEAILLTGRADMQEPPRNFQALIELQAGQKS